MDLLKIMTAGSVDDGKSTLIGRLFHDYGQIHQDNLESLSRDGLNLAHFTDGLKEERQRGITIDVAYKYLETPKRKFIIADCPGHKEFTRNMVTGATSADLVMILVDSARGITEQTHRHTAIVSWMGKSAVYLLNKMDVSDYSNNVFDDFAKQLRRFPLIPISALHGDNVLTPSKKMAWYKGPTLHEFIHSHPSLTVERESPLFPIQYSVGDDALGTLESGKIQVGDNLKCMDGIDHQIKKIFKGVEEVFSATSGEALRLTLSAPLKRGNVLRGAGVRISRHDSWTIEWCQLVSAGEDLLLRNKTTEYRITEIHPEEILELESGEWVKFSGPIIPDNIYRGTITLDRPLTFVSEDSAIFDRVSGLTVAAALIKPTLP